MTIATVTSVRNHNWGNAGPARIAPIPDNQPQSHAPPVVLPNLRAFALPDVNAPAVDVAKFLSVTAKLLQRMEQVSVLNCPDPPRRLDITA